MAKKNNLLEIMGGSSSGGNSAKPDNNLLDILKGNKTQSSSAASIGIGRNIDSQQAAWDQSLKEQPSTFKTWNPDVDTPKTNPLLSFTPEWQEQQAAKKAEEEKPKKKSWFASLIENANKKSEENPWDYDATNNIIDTSVPATPKEEKPKKVEPPKEEKKKEEPVNPFYTDLMRSIDDAAKENTAEYGLGNIDLNSRPKLQNPDGTISTVDSTTWEEDGKYIVMPTVINDNGEWKHVSPEEALDHYHKTGEYLGKFDTKDESDAYAQQLHEDQERLYGDNPFDWSGLLGRTWNTIKGSGKQIGSSFTNALGTYLDFMGENGFASNLGAAQLSANALAAPNLLNDEYLGMIKSERESGDAATKQAASDVQKIADDLGGSAQADLNAAKEGLGKFGQAGVDFGTNLIQMGSDAFIGFLTGGSALIPMAIRVFGQSAQEARYEGASTNEQVGYGLTNMAIEVGTEMLGDGLAGIYGRTGADEIAEETIRRLTKSETGRTVLRFLNGMASEGGEEVISDLLAPYAKMIYNNKSFEETFGEGYDPSELLYDYLLGAALGGLGGTVTAVKGDLNAAMRETDAIQAELEASGIDEGTAEQAAPIIKKANAGEELTKREKNILLEIMMREDTAAGSNEAGNAITETLEQSSISEEQKNAQAEAKAQADAEAKQRAQTTAELRALEERASNARAEAERRASEEAEARQQAEETAAERAKATAEANATEEKAAEARAKAEARMTAEAEAKSAADAEARSREIANAERIAEIQQEIEDLEQQPPSQERNDEILRLVEEQTQLTQENAAEGQQENPLIQQEETETAQETETAPETEPVVQEETAQTAEEETAEGQNAPAEETTEEEPPTVNDELKSKTDPNANPKYGTIQDTKENDAKFPKTQESLDYYENNIEKWRKIWAQATQKRRISGRAHLLKNGLIYVIDSRIKMMGQPCIYDQNGNLLYKAESPTISVYGFLKDFVSKHPEYGSDISVVDAFNFFEDADGNFDISDMNGNPTGKKLFTPESTQNATGTQAKTNNKNAPAKEETANTVEQEPTSPQAAEETTQNAEEEQAENEQPAEPAIPPVGKDSNPSGGEKVSKTSTNSMRNTAERNGAEQEALTYTPKSERESLNAAMNRADADAVGEMNRLADKATWTGEDIDTAFTIYGKLKFDSVKNGDSTAADAWARIVQQHGTETARALQAMSKWARTGAAAAVNAANQLADNQNLTQEQKAEITNKVQDFANRYDGTEDGDVTSIRQLILEMSDFRKTGTFRKGNLAKILDKINDFDWLKEVALRQMMTIPSDYTEQADLGKQLKTWQVNAQLSRLGTFFRNLGGNLSFGTLDTLSQDFAGWWIDSLISKATGKKEVGIDLGWLSKDARHAAMDALNRSIIEVACDVNMEGDTTRYGTSSSRTNKMTGNGFQRFMSRWEQLLGYSLTSSDRFFRGKIEQSYSEWLLNEANKKAAEDGRTLTSQEEAQIREVASMMADYRLFQNDGTAAKLSKGIHDVFNLVGIGGQVNGASRQGGFGLGDLINAYPRVPANLAVKALEYSPANMVKGFYEIAKLIKDTNNGVAVTGQQMQAAMDIARGMTGLPLIALFTALAKTKLFRNSDDEDDYDVAAENTAQGLSGVQWNLDATLRALDGGGAEWMDGDNIMKVSWLEPLNQFMTIASLIADSDEDRTFASMSNNYLEGTIQGVLDLPVMENMQNVINTLQYSTAESIWGKAGDALAQFGGSAVSGMLPAPAFSQLARVTDDYYRDTSGDTKLESAFNSLLNSIPGLRNTLPVKTDNFGNERLNEPNLLNRVLNAYVRPGNVSTFQETEVQDAIAKIYEATGNASVYPDRKGVKKISHGSKTYELTTEEQQRYHETAGSMSEKFISQFINSSYYKDLTDEQRAEVISDLNSTAKDVAKSQYLKTQGIDVDTSTYWHQAAFTTVKSLGSKANASLTKGKDVDFNTLDFIMKNVYPTLSAAEKEDLDKSYGRLDDMFSAYSVGLDTKKYYGYYQKYKQLYDNKTLTAQQKAERFATYVTKQPGLTEKQRSTIRNSFKFTTTLVADTKSYDKWIAAGLTPEQAEDFNKKINTDGKSSITNAERFAAIEKYATDADMAERLWEAMGSSTWTKSGKSYEKANPSTKFKGGTVGTPPSSSSSNNELLAILNGSAFGNGTSTQTGSSTSTSKDRNELLKILGVG